MPEKEAIEVAVESAKKLEWLAPAGPVPLFYTNSVQVETGPWDIKLRIGQVATLEKGVAQVREIAQVCMSPQHALAVFAVLRKSIRKYESQFGQIPRIGAAQGIDVDNQKG